MTTNTAPEINSWTARNGQVRRYINNWQELAGIHVDTYKTGNISSVSIDGEEISNRKGGLTASGKVWLDDADELHFDYHATDGLLSIEEKRERITAALIAAGVLADPSVETEATEEPAAVADEASVSDADDMARSVEAIRAAGFTQAPRMSGPSMGVRGDRVWRYVEGFAKPGDPDAFAVRVQLARAAHDEALTPEEWVAIEYRDGRIPAGYHLTRIRYAR